MNERKVKVGEIVIVMIPKQPKEGVSDAHADLRNNNARQLPGIVTSTSGGQNCNVRVQVDGYQMAPWKTSVPHQSIADETMLCFRYPDEEATIKTEVTDNTDNSAGTEEGTAAGPGE